MKTLIAAPLALGIALASSAAALAASDAPGPLHKYRTIHHRTLVARAEAPAPALSSAPGAWPYPLSAHETDGLSRNPDDCVKYGCIDNGGG
jgi:hypothetical protein